MSKFTDKLLKKTFGYDNETFIKIIFKSILVITCAIYVASLILNLFGLDILGYYFTSLFGSDYGDFFDVLNFISTRNPYQYALEVGKIANYPPLGYMLLYPFVLLTKLGGSQISVANPMGIVSMFVYVLLTFTPVLIIAYKKLPFKKNSNLLVVLSVTVSYICYFEFVRLNINILALDFVMLFFCFYKSDNRWFRGLAVVSIAAAGAIKLYPFFLVVLLLKEKRIKDFILSVICLVSLIILPFFFFENGLYNIKYMIEQMATFVGEDQSKYFNMNDMAFMKLLRSVWAMLGFSPTDAVAIKAFKVIKYLFFIVSALGLFYTKNNFKFALLATLAYLNFTDNNYTYSLIFLLVPFILFFNDNEVMGENVSENKVTPEVLFYILIVWLMFNYFYDLVFVAPIICLLILLVNVKTGYHKKTSAVLAVIVGIVILLIAVNCVKYFVIRNDDLTLNMIEPMTPQAFLLAIMMQPARALPPFILQVILIVEAFQNFFASRKNGIKVER